MASYTDVQAKTATLTGTANDVVSITGSASQIEIVNHDATENLWFKMGDEDPGVIAAGGNGVTVVLPGRSFPVYRAGKPTVVRLVGQDNNYTVQGADRWMGHSFAYTPGGPNVAIEDGGTGADTDTAARAALGLEIGVDVQAFGAPLDDIAGITGVQGDILFFDGANWVALGAGDAGQVLTSHGAGTSPTWETP